MHVTLTTLHYITLQLKIDFKPQRYPANLVYKMSPEQESGIHAKPRGVRLTTDGVLSWTPNASTLLGLYAVQVRSAFTVALCAYAFLTLAQSRNFLSRTDNKIHDCAPQPLSRWTQVKVNVVGTDNWIPLDFLINVGEIDDFPPPPVVVGQSSNVQSTKKDTYLIRQGETIRLDLRSRHQNQRRKVNLKMTALPTGSHITKICKEGMSGLFARGAECSKVWNWRPEKQGGVFLWAVTVADNGRTSPPLIIEIVVTDNFGRCTDDPKLCDPASGLRWKRVDPKHKCKGRLGGASVYLSTLRASLSMNYCLIHTRAHSTRLYTYTFSRK
jgi:hypothetical protein